MDQGRTKDKGRTRHQAPGTRDPIVNIHVIPRASKSAIAGTRDDALLVRLKAPPVDGAANAELIRLLADLLDVRRRNVEIVSGERSRVKRVRIRGRTAADVERILSIPAEAARLRAKRSGEASPKPRRRRGFHGNGQLPK